MINDILSETRDKMKATLSVFEEDLAGIRGNRASTALVDRLKVDYYGQETELRQLANISTPEALQIIIRPFDTSIVKEVERAIQTADIGVNPNSDGGTIYLNMPALTKERRQELVKVLHKRTEDARVSIRNIRRNANQDVQEFEKEGMVSEDESRQGQEKIQGLTDDFIKRIEDASKAKEHEILEM